MFYVENTWENELRNFLFTSRGFVVVFESCMILVQIYQSNELIYGLLSGVWSHFVLIAQRKTYVINTLEIQAFGRPFCIFTNVLKDSYVVAVFP